MSLNQIPAQAGVGLRHPHYQEALTTKPNIPWFEVHSENYFGEGGLPHFYLEKIAERYPLSFHGVGLSIGSADKLDLKHLKRLKQVIDIYQPALVSEHLSWSHIGNRNFNDLLPLPYTEEALTNFCDHVNQVQDYIGRQILIENPSSYIKFACSKIPEWDFFAAIPEKTGCGLLLDVNNIYVSCFNHGYAANDYLSVINPDFVKEYHLAGYAHKKLEAGELLIDDHGSKVHDPVWDLFDTTLDIIGLKPTLIEWDTNIPDLITLQTEAAKAQKIMDRKHVKKPASTVCL